MSISVLPNEKSSRSLSELEFLHNPDSKDARLGKGSFAHVKLVKEKITGSLLALKSVDITLEKASKSDMHNLRTEILVHRELDHPNIIKFHDYIQEEGRIYMLLDYAPKGNLYSYMHKNKSLPLEHVFKFFYQTCLAMNYIHGKDILHRDIKPENLLLDKDLNIKLCDFGWAARSIRDKRTTFCGTYEYMAPELVAKSTYNYKVDIWSLGILLYELFHSEAPYKGRTLEDIKVSITRESIHFNPSIQPELKDLITFILKKDPEQRPEISTILNHPWIHHNLARFDPAYKGVVANELQQPGQQQNFQQLSQMQLPRPQSAPAVKDNKPRAVSTSHGAIEQNGTVIKMSSFGLLQRQMSDNREVTTENKEIKEAVNNGYMTPGHKTRPAHIVKDISRQDSIGCASPLIEKTAAGLSLAIQQKNFSEGHYTHFQNDSSMRFANNVNLQLGKPVRSGTKGMENEVNMTPEKQQKTQELIQQAQMSRSHLQRRQQGLEKSITKENMHGHNLSITTFNQPSAGFNSTRHAYTTANATYGNINYENFTQAVNAPHGYKSATKTTSLSKDFSNGLIPREPLSATTKLPARIEYPSDIPRNSGGKANFGGRLKRDGVKLDVQRFYPFGTNSSVSTNSPSHSSFEVNSAGINYNKTSWTSQGKGSLNSSPYVFTRADSDTRLNYTNSTNSATNPGYSNFANGYNPTQGNQAAYRGANSPVIERHLGMDVREGGYKVVRSNTQLDMRSYVKGASMN